jgi:hypothetical protein
MTVKLPQVGRVSRNGRRAALRKLELADLIRQQVAAATKPLRDRIKELEAQIAELQSGGVRYQGIYQRAQQYRRGDITTHDGSMFAAINDVPPNEQPGRSQSWQLCCRAGRDGKDGKAAA